MHLILNILEFEGEGGSVWISLNHRLTNFKKPYIQKKHLDVVLLNSS